MGGFPSSNTEVNLPPDFPDDFAFFHLKNLGNTCFCNSVIQSFLYSQFIGEYFNYLRVLKFPEQFKNTPLYQFLMIFTKKVQFIQSLSQTSNISRDIFIRPSDFLDSIYCHTNQFVRNQQNDSHEFLLYLISSFDNTVLDLKKLYNIEKENEPQMQKKAEREAIDDSHDNKNINNTINTAEKDNENIQNAASGNTNEAKEKPLEKDSNNHSNTILNDDENAKNIQKIPLFSILFEGTRSSSFECAYCHHTQDKLEIFTYLDIGIQPDNNGKELDLQSLIHISLDPDKIRAEEGGWICSSCKRKGVNVDITSFIKDLPMTLIIQLQRFKYSKKTQVMEKNNSFVKIQNEISVNSGGGPQKYQLKTIICHIGSSLYQGHFIALHRVPRTNKVHNNNQSNEAVSDSSDYWVLTSDSQIKLINQETVDALIRGHTRDRITYTPYVMLYEINH